MRTKRSLKAWIAGGAVAVTTVICFPSAAFTAPQRIPATSDENSVEVLPGAMARAAQKIEALEKDRKDGISPEETSKIIEVELAAAIKTAREELKNKRREDTEVHNAIAQRAQELQEEKATAVPATRTTVLYSLSRDS